MVWACQAERHHGKKEPTQCVGDPPAVTAAGGGGPGTKQKEKRWSSWSECLSPRALWAMFSPVCQRFSNCRMFSSDEKLMRKLHEYTRDGQNCSSWSQGRGLCPASPILPQNDSCSADWHSCHLMIATASSPSLALFLICLPHCTRELSKRQV